jgi:hypothetical protein
MNYVHKALFITIHDLGAHEYVRISEPAPHSGHLETPHIWPAISH